MKVGTGLRTGYSPSAVSWKGSAKTWATSGTGVAALPCLEGSWPRHWPGDSAQCHLSFCHADCQVLVRKLPSSARTGTTPQRGRLPRSDVHVGCTGNPVLQVCLHLAALPRVPCTATVSRDVGAWRIDAGLGIYLLRISSYFVLADFANTCTSLKLQVDLVLS